MYTISQIRRRIDALKRKYAADLTIIRLRPLAEEYCLLWTEALSEGSNPPDSYAFIRHIARQGFRLNTFTALHLYLERCREGGNNPNTIGIVASLLPQVRPARLEELLLSDSADVESVLRRTFGCRRNPRISRQLAPQLALEPPRRSQSLQRPSQPSYRPAPPSHRPAPPSHRPAPSSYRPESRYPVIPPCASGIIHNPEPALSVIPPRAPVIRGESRYPAATLHARESAQPPSPALSATLDPFVALARGWFAPPVVLSP